VGLPSSIAASAIRPEESLLGGSNMASLATGVVLRQG
jgi:hypothetical protein